MPKYTVRIETSVEVEAPNPTEAICIADGWAREDLADSNGIAYCYAETDQKCKKTLLSLPCI